MDFIKQQISQNTGANQGHESVQQKEQSGGSVMNQLNNAMGGGASGEQKEDALDKGIDWVQEHMMKQGPQDNESALEQAKDEQIANAIRGQYKNMTGKEFPIADK